MPVLSKFQAVTQQGYTIGPSAIAEQLADLGLSVRNSPPSSLSVTATPLFNRIAVQVDGDPTDILAGSTMEGFIDYLKDGKWRCGTVLKKRYGANEYYGNCFNLREATEYGVRTTVRIRNADGILAREYVSQATVTTKDSTVPIDEGDRIAVYVDAVSGSNSNDGLTPATPKKDLDGSGTESVNDLILADNDRGYDIYVMNGAWVGAATATRRLIGIRGAANNWIRILPYDANAKITCAQALNGTWTDEGSGIFSMSIESITSATNTLANLWDDTVGAHLYPFKTRAAFDAAAISDGTGYWIDDDNSESNATYSAGVDVLYVRLVSGANPGTGRLTGAFGSGLVLQNSRYVLIDGLPFRSCGVSSKNNRSAGSTAALQIQDFSAECQDIIVRNCPFDRNRQDIHVYGLGTYGCHDVLIEENDFVFDGPWDHFYSGYGSETPYVQTDSWSHIKSSQWEKHAIIGLCDENLVVRNNTCRGMQIVQTTQAGAGQLKNFHQHGNTITECWDDAVGDIEGDGGINIAIHNETVVDATTLIGMSPLNAGPLWFFASSIDGYIHGPIKVGNQAVEGESNGPKIIANISCKAQDWGSDDYRDMASLLNGAHSNLEAYNIVFDELQCGGVSDAVYWIQQAVSASYVIDGPNSWTNCLFHIRNNATPVVPQINWRSSGGSLTDYATFAAANAGIGEDDTQFVDCVGTYSDNGDPAPFLTDVADGLNPAITTKSVYVRGVTDVAGDGSGEPVAASALSIGSFPLRTAY